MSTDSSSRNSTATACTNNGDIISALLRVLKFSKVKFIRFLTLDLVGNVRCKVMPLEIAADDRRGVAFAMAVVGGLPSHVDVIVPESGLTAAGSVQLVPDFCTLRVLPYAPDSALVFGNLCESEQQTTCTSTRRSRSDYCCRSLLQSVVQDALTNHQITFTMGAEIEFVLFDRNNNDTPVDATNFCDTAILDKYQHLIADLYDCLTVQMDIPIELMHAESGHGQFELILKKHVDSPVRLADHIVLARQTIASCARKFNLKAIFLPKYNENQAGNGLHVHISMHSNGQNLFLTDARNAILNGVLKHLPSLTALTMPTTNSFRRVGPGCWTGSSVQAGFDDKECALRVLSDRFEYKLLDSTANIYLALSGILTSCLDGIDPGSSGHPDAVATSTLPTSVAESLDLLERNELLGNKLLPAPLLRSYSALRRAEAERDTTFEQELAEALERAR